MTDAFEQHPADTDWHRWAPIGQTLDTSQVPGSGPAPSIAAFELLPLAEMLVPEKPRGGELDPRNAGTAVRLSTRSGKTTSGELAAECRGRRGCRSSVPSRRAGT